jgi:hypothetical protein
MSITALVAAAVALLAIGPGWRQAATQGLRPHQGVQQPDPPGIDPPGIIDGAQAPELIPDRVAFSLLLLAAAADDDASELDKGRARSAARTPHFSDGDGRALLRLASQYRRHLRRLDARADEVYKKADGSALTAAQSGALARLTREREEVLDRYIDLVGMSMSREGYDRFSANLREAKGRMKYFPE